MDFNSFCHTASLGSSSSSMLRPRSSREFLFLSQAPVTCRTPLGNLASLMAIPAMVPMKVESIPVHCSRSTTTVCLPCATWLSAHCFI